MSGGDLNTIMAAALEVSRRRAAILERMRVALELDDTLQALQCARELCGLKPDEKNDRVN